LKKLLLLYILLIPFFRLIADEEMPIYLRDPFHLNPITGINGDEYEASSKFVQRMIFSPLVFPIEDPYLKDNYRITMDLSIIDNKIQYQESGKNSFADFIIDNSNSKYGGQAKIFKVKLRENLKFTKSKNRQFDLTAYDVVYSYRLARITTDRVYKVSGGDMKINTLLYAKMKSIENIYYDSASNYIIFETDREMSCQAFVNLLVYVPILSIQQILKVNPKQDSPISKSLANSLKFSLLPGGLNNIQYNDYDLNYLIRPGNRSLVNDFYKSPIGYGQFSVVLTLPYGGGDIIDDLFTTIKLERNPEWCLFPGTNNSEKNISNIIVSQKIIIITN